MKALILILFSFIFSITGAAQCSSTQTDSNIETIQKLNWLVSDYQDRLRFPCGDNTNVSSIEESLLELESNHHLYEVIAHSFDTLIKKQINDPNIDFLSLEMKCPTFTCMAKEIFGEEKGPLMLYLMHHFNINTNHNPVTSNELINLIKAASKFPRSHYFTFYNVNYKPQRTLNPNNKRSIASATGGHTLRTFGHFYQRTNDEQIAILIHEFAHLHAVNYQDRYHRIDYTPRGWLRISGWEEHELLAEDEEDEESDKKEKNKVQSWKFDPGKANQFVSERAQHNPAEDFAESVVAYTSYPDRLKKASLEKYNFLKNHFFLGKEFKDDSHCHNFLPPHLKPHLDSYIQSRPSVTAMPLNHELAIRIIRARCLVLSIKETNDCIDSKLAVTPYAQSLTPLERENHLRHLRLILGGD